MSHCEEETRGLVALDLRDPELSTIRLTWIKRSKNHNCELDLITRSKTWLVNIDQLAPSFLTATQLKLIKRHPLVATPFLGYLSANNASRGHTTLSISAWVTTKWRLRYWNHTRSPVLCDPPVSRCLWPLLLFKFSCFVDTRGGGVWSVSCRLSSWQDIKFLLALLIRRS